MHHVAPPHPALKREQSKNHQGPSSKLRIRDRRPRQHSKYDVRDKSCCKAIHCLQILRDQRSGFHHWCTGKDSNLRTSLGGTDLQSVGFNHSPTCADTAGRCSRCPSSSSSRTIFFRDNQRIRKPRQHTSASGLPTQLLQTRLSQIRETKN